LGKALGGRGSAVAEDKALTLKKCNHENTKVRKHERSKTRGMNGKTCPGELEPRFVFSSFRAFVIAFEIDREETMNEPHDPNRTVDVPWAPADSLDAGLAAGFGPAGPPRSSLGAMRPVLLKEAEGESAHVVKPKSDAMPPPEQTGDRYQLQGEIARGGMGAVLRGRDVDLGRDLAVKVLLEKHVHRPEVARRFIEEAQIGGQLQHPGVVPVYDIGRFGERPFFTMKLVKGMTLAALLGERNVGQVCNLPEDNPASYKLAPQDLPRLLAIALQVAQTLAYAHAKGVIHRDLKPANVMVGAFGEVQVMDWGLAKVLAEGGIADEERASRERERPEDVTAIRTARSTGSARSYGTVTEAGTLLGTPAYVPPEQANGDIAHLDRRADVFGLGAILCEILTGKPPYVGRSSEEIHRKACNGDLADTRKRLDGSGADAELIVLTKACRSPEAIDRPKDAQAVADRLTAYQSGVQERLHQAELAEAEAKAKAVEEVKRRRLTLALAGTVLLAVTLGGGGWLWVKNERDTRQAQLTREVNDALNKATALREQAKAAPVGGAALFAQAREQAQRALALVENGSADGTLLAQVRQLQAVLDEEEKDRRLIAALDEARLKQAETLSKNRFAIERAVPLFREAFRAYGMAAGEGDPMAVAERIRRRPTTIREAIVATLDEWDDLTSNPKVVVAEPHREWQRAVRTATEPEDAWSRQVRAARAEKDKSKRRAALTALAASADVESIPLRALTRLAHLGAVGEEDDLEPADAVKLLRRVQARYPADFWVNEQLGSALQKVTPPDRAEAVRFLTAAVALRPKSPGANLNLGLALHLKGQQDGAIACFQRAIALDPKYAMAHNHLGNALKNKGRLDKAIACYQKAIALDPKLAWAFQNLGIALHDKGQVQAAIAYYQKAIALDPNLAWAHYKLGYALHKKGKLDEAIAWYQKAIALDPKLAMAHANLGVALDRKGQVDKAILVLQKALDLDPNFAPAHNELGAILCDDKRDYDGAIACYQKAIALDPKFARAHVNLGNALCRKGEVGDGIACYQKAIALDPKLAVAYANLGLALYRKGQVDKAILLLQKALDLDPKFAPAHDELGAILCNVKRDYDGAIACFQKAIALDPKLARAHVNLCIALCGKGRVEDAIACYQKAIALDPRLAWAHYNLGAILCDFKRDYDGAIASFKKAIALDPKYTDAHFSLGIAFYGKGQVDKAIACWRKTIVLAPKFARAHNNLGDGLLTDGRVDEAIACFKKAMALDPKGGMAYLKPAALLAWFAQDAELAAICDQTLRVARDTRDPTMADRVAKICSLRQADDKIHQAALVLARRAVERGKGHPLLMYFQMDLGMAEYRSRHYAAADAALLAASRLGTNNYYVSVTTAFYRAMTLFRQGKQAEARKLATEAVAKMKPLPVDQRKPLDRASNHDDLILWLAYMEAKAMVRFAAAPRPKGKTDKKAAQEQPCDPDAGEEASKVMAMR
jgi:serine/threonine-protein kinase